MWHMPGHTFSKLKRPDDAAWQQEASTRVDHAYMIRSYILPDQIHNYAHNEEWLTRTYNDLGRAKDAAALARSLIAIPRHPTYNTLDKSSTSSSYGRTRLIETLIKWELWQDLKAFTTVPAGHPAHDVVRLHAAGLAAYHLDDAKALTLALKELDAVKTETKLVKLDTSKLKPKTSDVSDKSEKSDPKKKSDKPAEKPEVKAKNNALAELKALIALLDKKVPKVEKNKLLDALKTTDIPKERQARYWLKLDDKTKAAELTKNFTQDLVGLAIKTEVLQACGKTDDAKKAFEDTRKQAFAMDRDLPIAKRLDALAKTFGITGDWPTPAPKRTDSGIRPPT
jgi:hypothetical protein